MSRRRRMIHYLSICICFIFSYITSAILYHPADIAGDAMYGFPAPCAEVSILNLQVSCQENAGYADHIDAFPDSWIFFKVIVKNGSKDVDIDNCYICDQLSGEYDPGSFTAIDPPDFTLFQCNVGGIPPKGEIVIKYKIKTRMSKLGL